MVAKLNQVIAVVDGKKKKALETFTNAYHQIQKTALFEGISRNYKPKDDEGEKLPPENKIVQAKVGELVKNAVASLTEMYDVVATVDRANCDTMADVKVGERVVLTKVPATTLLFLEKQLVDLHTFVSKLPTLDPAEEWTYQETSDQYASRESETVRTKKVPKAFVKAPATEQHPAQVDVFHEDVLVGNWKTIKFSGAIPAKEKNATLARVTALKEAVLKARAEANMTEAPNVSIGKEILGFVFE